MQPYHRHSSHHQVAISPASAQESESGFGFGSGRPDLAGLLHGLLQDEGGQPAVEAVVAEEEEYEEEYGEEQGAEWGEVEEECKSWREGQGVPGETVGRVCLGGPEPIVGESKPPVAASTVEQDLEEANQEDGEVDAVDELEDEETEVSCVEEGKVNLGHNVMVQHGVPTPRLCALVCQVMTNDYTLPRHLPPQTQPLCHYWNHLASQAPFPWDSKCYLKVIIAPDTTTFYLSIPLVKCPHCLQMNSLQLASLVSNKSAHHADVIFCQSLAPKELLQPSHYHFFT